MTINQALTLTRKMMNDYPELRYWKVTHNNRKKSFGLCNYTDSVIQLSSHLVPVMTDEAVKDTIIHEIAHALCPCHHHDNVWKEKCIELGGNGQRCGGSDKYKDGVKGHKIVQEQLAKYTLTCPVCDQKYHLNRRPAVSKSCGMHGRGFNPEYRLVLTQNY